MIGQGERDWMFQGERRQTIQKGLPGNAKFDTFTFVVVAVLGNMEGSKHAGGQFHTRLELRIWMGLNCQAIGSGIDGHWLLLST